MGISKIYVNDNLRMDLTQTTATANDVAVGKKFFNAKGDLATRAMLPPSSPMLEYSYEDYSHKVTINLEDGSLEWPNLIKDYITESYQDVTYDINLNKNSYLPCYACYTSGANYSYVKLICTEPMTYEEVWECLGEPSSPDSSEYLGGIEEIAGQIEEASERPLPNWRYIPNECIHFFDWCEKTVVPAGVEYLGSVGYNVNFLKCLGETPPETSWSALGNVSYIEVPVGYKEIYQAADGWCNHAQKIFETGEALPDIY